MLAFIPFIVLIALLVCCISVFGNATLDGASQVALIIASGVCVLIGWGTKRLSWENLEKNMTSKVANCTPSIIILLLIGAIGGTWMVSGIVPTMIYYGLQILSPQWFLVSTCLICALISLLIGSSWTTIATVGVALLGIGKALGFSDGWTAGAIISGAYFGDKLSPLSDTTVLASSVVGTPLFTHIKYMMQTTVPTFIVTLVIFFVSGLMMDVSGTGDVSLFMVGLARTFVISPWLLLVPLVMGVMIARRWPSLVVLFLAVLIAAIVALIVQPERVREISNGGQTGFLGLYEGVMRACYDSTFISTGVEELDKLVSTRGMGGMMPTVWLIISAQVFAGALTASGQLEDIMNYFKRFVKGTTSLVGTTVGSAIFLNVTTADQFLSIILTSSMFKGLYEGMGYEKRLLSRSCEDGGTVTSVLVPWNTCGLTQSTVLGVATITYLPYCFFNLLSPFVSVLVAAVGWKIENKNNESSKITKAPQ
ncbi:MAG: Na+/H+ antiporter NhaC [Prevotella sp.]|nr:Na+/H+ antiporter NhaC [Prevotella sp.]